MDGTDCCQWYLRTRRRAITSTNTGAVQPTRLGRGRQILRADVPKALDDSGIEECGETCKAARREHGECIPDG